MGRCRRTWRMGSPRMGMGRTPCLSYQHAIPGELSSPTLELAVEREAEAGGGGEEIFDLDWYGSSINWIRRDFNSLTLNALKNLLYSVLMWIITTDVPKQSEKQEENRNVSYPENDFKSEKRRT
mmetsp:Transcript_23354/g.75916  ORF Transcript_23354/g.75916 Transcript_23354/m.75916 type:complete len:124 (+) Transcript_23354:643-1014(+)